VTKLGGRDDGWEGSWANWEAIADWKSLVGDAAS